MLDSVRIIAFYLPQFHPIPENDEWWGRGFTEWTNVVRAQPTFRGHYQPHLPADLGFYDLRLPEVRIAQAEMALRYGIHGFCYYHYWFGGRRLLERPFNEVMTTGRPDFPFCICWANEPWTRTWSSQGRDVLMPQSYSPQDDVAHIRWLAEAMDDPRYIRVRGRPLLLVYRAHHLPEPRRTTDLWREECARLGVVEPFLCRVESSHQERDTPGRLGFDAAVEFQPDWRLLNRPSLRRTLPWRAARRLGVAAKGYGLHRVYDYEDLVRWSLAKPIPDYPSIRCVTPSWDNTARRQRDAIILRGSTPALYEQWLGAVAERERQRERSEGVIFVNAWNEWAEGNHLEPCRRWGHAYLEATQRVLQGSKITG